MERFGEFAVVETLHQGVESTILRLKHPRRFGTWVAKVFHPIGYDPASPSSREAVEGFLDAAETQRKIASPHWLAIEEAGPRPDGAYWIAPEAPRSLLAVEEESPPRTDDDLRALALAIVDGLQALQKECARAHGNLKPANVLIAGEDPYSFTACQFLLTDPAPPPAARLSSPKSAAKATVPLDIAALGHILRRLAHAAHSAAQSKDVKPLNLKKWDAVCARLTDRPKHARPLRLEDAALILRGAHASRRRRLATSVVLTATAAAIAAAILITPGLLPSSLSLTQFTPDTARDSVPTVTPPPATRPTPTPADPTPNLARGEHTPGTPPTTQPQSPAEKPPTTSPSIATVVTPNPPTDATVKPIAPATSSTVATVVTPDPSSITTIAKPTDTPPPPHPAPAPPPPPPPP
jgi:hypothetical protein